MDAVRETLAKQVRELEARNAALKEHIHIIFLCSQAMKYISLEQLGYALEQIKIAETRIAALAANAPAPVEEREPIGSLK